MGRGPLQQVKERVRGFFFSEKIDSTQFLEHPLSKDYVEDNDINQNDIEKEGDDTEEQEAQQEASERNVEHLPKRRHEQQNDR